MKVTDLLALGLLLQSFFVFGVAYNLSGFIQLVGLIGASITIIVEAIFLYGTWLK